MGAELVLELVERPAVDRLDGAVEAVPRLDGGEEAGELVLAALVDEEADHLVGLPVEEADVAGVAARGEHRAEGDEAVDDEGDLEGVAEAPAGLRLRVDGRAFVQPGGNLAEGAFAGGLDEDVGELVAQGVAAVARPAAAVDDEDDVVRDLAAAEEGGGVVDLAAVGLGRLQVGLGGEEHGLHGHDLELRLEEASHARVGAVRGFEVAEGDVLPVAVEVDAHEVVMDAAPVLAGRQVEVAVLLGLDDRAVIEDDFPVVEELAADGDIAEGAGRHAHLDPHDRVRGHGLELLGLGAGEGAGADDAVAEAHVGDRPGSASGQAEAQELGELVLDARAELGRLGGGRGGQPDRQAEQERQRRQEERLPHASSPTWARR